jgi:DNA repair exonuclease SbcCD ATPase subunit
MQVKPVAGPSAIQQPQSNAADAKARAVAAFNQAAKAPTQPAQPAQQVVQNQNNISAEELGAIQTPETRQDDNTEADQEVTAAPTETPKETPKTEEETALSRQFAQLARQERALRAKAQQQDQALKAREAALQAREAELASKSQTDMTKYLAKDAFKQDPLTALAEAGISYEELTQQIISQQPVDPRIKNTISRLETEIRELRAANEETKKSAAEQQTQAYQAAVKQIEMDAKNLVKSDPTAYEAISKTGTVKEVVKLITETYKKDGVLLTVEEAAQQVEDYLVEENYNMATKIEKIKRKIQASAPNVSDKSAQALAEKAVKQTQPMKTLTNATSSSRQLSAKERAILAFKGELKS